jgi:type II secretory pathway predicted ATPase ExeA
MEEFRGLLNLEIPDKKLLNIIFFGLPELDNIMKLDEPLAQRVAFKYTLKPLSAEASESYIKHRLKVANCQEMPFELDALPWIHKLSGGVPRLINTICDNALFETYLRRGSEVSTRIIKNVAEDLGLVEMQASTELPSGSADDLEEFEMIFEDLEEK